MPVLPGGNASEFQSDDMMLCRRASESGHSRVMPNPSEAAASENRWSIVTTDVSMAADW